MGVSATLLVLGPTAAPAGSSVEDAGALGTLGSSAAGGATSPTPSSVGVLTTGTGTPASTAPTPPSTSAAPVTADRTVAPTASAPGLLAFPDLDVTATVLPVGVDGNGAMEVPVDVSTVGWYRFGPIPGSPLGSAVLTGHVDSADQGRGIFADLAVLEPGDPIEVTDADGTVRRFEVVARESWPKDEVPLDRLFDRSGPGRLVLITCGGAFDPGALSYEENLAVTAVPVTDS